jgi:pyruvate/2-oxoglutarate/acetoin dehydrogenase E1 component
MGGRRAYGPTHSQTLEKIYLGIPGLKVLAPCTLGNPGDLLSAAIQDEDPVLFVEHKLLYSRSLQDGDSLPDYEIVEFRQPGTYPAYMLRIKGVPKAHITMVSYGYMAELAVQSALRLAYEDEIFVELVVLTQLSPFVLDPVVDSVRDTRRIITIEEGTLSLGWGAEVIARVSGELGQGLLKANRVAAQDLPVPASTVLEEFVLPDVKDIITTAKAIVSESR